MSPARKRRFRRHSSLFELVSHFRFSRRSKNIDSNPGSLVLVHESHDLCIHSRPTALRGTSYQKLVFNEYLLVSRATHSSPNLRVERKETMEAPPQTSDALPFSLQNQGKSASLGHSTIIWLVVLACIIATAFIVIACLLCRCRRKRKDRRFSTGYGIHDGRHEFHHSRADPTAFEGYCETLGEAISDGTDGCRGSRQRRWISTLR